MNTLNSLEAEYRMFARDVYVKTLDMSKAMAEISRLQELKKQEEERIRKEEEAKAAKAAAEEKAAESVPEPVEVVQKSEKTAQNTAGITQKEEVAPHENEKVA